MGFSVAELVLRAVGALEDGCSHGSPCSVLSLKVWRRIKSSRLSGRAGKPSRSEAERIQQKGHVSPLANDRFKGFRCPLSSGYETKDTDCFGHVQAHQAIESDSAISIHP